MNVQAQLNAVATEAADPRIFPGKISPIINCKKCKFSVNLKLLYLDSLTHGIGPKPSENPITYITKLARGSHPGKEIT